MPKPYSNALRLKVVEAIVLNGMKRCEAHEQFNVQEELAEICQENISDRTISLALKKINITRKKRLTDTKNVTHKRDRYFSNS